MATEQRRASVDVHAVDILRRIASDLESGALVCARIEVVNDARVGLSIECVAGDPDARSSFDDAGKTPSATCVKCGSSSLSPVEDSGGKSFLCRDCGAEV